MLSIAIICEEMLEHLVNAVVQKAVAYLAKVLGPGSPCFSW